MLLWRFSKVMLVLSTTLVLMSCSNENKSSKKAKPLNLTIQALNDASSFNLLLAKDLFGLTASGSSALDPVVEGVKVKFHQSIDFCTGTYGVGGSCNGQIYEFPSPVEVELTNNVEDQLNVSASTTIPAGTYTHARISFQSRAAIKAYYTDGASVSFTTSTGVQTVAGTTPPSSGYDYLIMESIYKDQGHDASTQGFQETTYFDTPFIYDGESPITLKIHLDLMRAGKFDASNSDGWHQYYLSLFMTFEDEEAEVKTYELTAAGSSESTIMTLVLDSKGELIGGRTRGGNVNIEQFVKNWSCNTTNDCSFLVGDFGKPNDPVSDFKHAVSGFNPEAGGSFQVLDSSVNPPVTRTINYSLISR